MISPADQLYFDYHQGPGEPGAPWEGNKGGPQSIAKMLAWEPVPDSFTPEESAHVLGIEACVWTEFIATERYLQFMTFPRFLRLAEIAWRPKGPRDEKEFSKNGSSRTSRRFARKASMPGGANGTLMSSSRTEALAPIAERVAPTPEQFRAEILPSGQPMVLRGIARDWPLVIAAREDARKAMSLLEASANWSADQCSAGRSGRGRPVPLRKGRSARSTSSAGRAMLPAFSRRFASRRTITGLLRWLRRP